MRQSTSNFLHLWILSLNNLIVAYCIQFYYYFSHHITLKIIKSIGSIYVQKKINFVKNISNYGRSAISINKKESGG